jgi:hypothetical protein
VPTILLVHSPLLTSATWDGLRPHLDAFGWRVVAPDLGHLTEPPDFHAAFCAAAAAGVADDPPAAIVGHSRAGPYLPGITDAIGRAGLDVVFLDARLPYPGTSWLDELPQDRAAWLRRSAVAGRLPSWDRWFPEGSLTRLLPDPAERSVLWNLPELPWSVVSEVLPKPGTPWHTARRVYLQLSAAYRTTADRAERKGYQVRRVDANHLAMVTHPALVADQLDAALRR